MLFLISSILLSYISYNFYEKKFRYYLSFSKTIFVSTFFCFSIICFSHLSLKSNGFAYRVPEIFSKNYESIVYNLKDQNKKICYDRKKDFCHINKNKNKTRKT